MSAASENVVPTHAAPKWGLAAAVFGAGMAFLLLAFADSWRLLFQSWGSSETYSHGYLVAPVSAWLVWRMRAQLAAMTPTASLVGLVVLLAALLLWAAGEIADVNVVRYVAVTAMIPGLAWLCFGTPVARALAFPLGFLVCMIPAGEGLVPWLMEGTADATVFALKLSGIPVHREGLHFSLPTGRWSVVEACSGLRYVIAALVLSLLFSYLNYRRIAHRVVFVAVAVVIAVVANWARAYLIVLIGHFSNMRYGVGDDHVVYGWVFFGLVMFVVFWMGMRFSDEDGNAAAVSGSTASTTPTPASGSTAAAPSTAASQAAMASVVRAATRTRAGGFAAFVAVSLIALFGIHTLQDITPRADAHAQLVQQVRLEHAVLDIPPAFEGHRAVHQGRIPPTEAGAGVQVYVAYFARQHDGGEMVRWGNTVLALVDKTWGTFSRRVVPVDEAPDALRVEERVVRNGNDERLLWSWYTVGGRDTTEARTVKLLTLRGFVTGAGDHSTVNVLLSPAGVGRDQARARLRAAAAEVDAAARALTGPAARR